MKKTGILLLFILGYTQVTFGQHDMMNMGQPKKATPKPPSQKSVRPPVVPAKVKSMDHTGHEEMGQPAPINGTSKTMDQPMHERQDSDSMKKTMANDMQGIDDMDGMDMPHKGHSSMAMSHAFSPNLPMSRNGSGTAWLPDNSAMYGYMLHAKGWMFMFHGNIFIRYNNQDFTNQGSRGNSRVDAPNMLMAMGQKKIGKNGLFHFNTMFSLDAAIAGGSGYPLLFQTGETWGGKPLIDRQHPHDLFSELSVSYAQAFSEKADAFLYLGYPGEPALGAVTFMHRPSGMFNPDAPISHHWVDATHITFGVATLGFRYGKFKLEGSAFTGREPDENRYNFDKPLFDSRSARVSFNPNKAWALQVSHGFLKSPEASHPSEDIYRTTASSTYSHRFAKEDFLDVTGLWALNKIPNEQGSNAALLEATLRLKKLALFGRYEWVQKSGEELVLDGTQFNLHSMFAVNALTFGAGYDLVNIAKTRLALGAQVSIYNADDRLDKLYGNMPLAGEVYLHIYPGLMK